MNKFKKILVIIGVSLGLMVSVIYSIPMLLDFNQYKSYIVKQIEKDLGIQVLIVGDISITLLPRVQVIASDVKVLDIDRNTGKQIENGLIKSIFLESNLNNILDRNFTDFGNIVLKGLDIRLIKEQTDPFAENNSSVKENFFHSIKDIYIQDSSFRFYNNLTKQESVMTDINVFISKKTEVKNLFKIIGDIKINDIEFNLDSSFNINSFNTYDGDIHLFKKEKLGNLDIKVKASKRYDMFTLKGKFNLKSRKFTKFMNLFTKDFSDLGIPKLNTKIIGDIKLNYGVLTIDNINFSCGKTFAKGKYIRDFAKPYPNLDLDFSNFELSYMYANSLRGHAKRLYDLKNMISSINLNLQIGSINTPESKITDLKLETAANSMDSIVINLGEANMQNKYIAFDGNIKFMEQEPVFDLFIDTNLSKIYNFNFINKLEIKSFQSLLVNKVENISFKDLFIKTNIGDIEGSIVKNSNNNVYNVNISSKHLNLDKLLKDDIFTTLERKSEVPVLGKNNFIVKINAGNVLYNNKQLKKVNLSTNLIDSNLMINNLSFTKNSHKVKISGSMLNINDYNSAIFDNFYYQIEAFDFKNIKSRYLEIPHLKDLLKRESGKMIFYLKGNAFNPKVEIKGNLSNLSLSATINDLTDSSFDIDVNLKHKNLKTFFNNVNARQRKVLSKILKSNIPFSASFKLIAEKDNPDTIFKNIKLKLLKNNIIGSVTLVNDMDAYVDLKIDKLDLTDIVKNSNNTYKTNVFLHFLNNIDFNIKLDINDLTTYSRLYDNVFFDFNVFNNKPYILLDSQFSDSKFVIDSKIIDNRYIGEAIFENIQMKDSLFGMEELDVKNGTLNGSIVFDSLGKNTKEFLANLNGKMSLNFKNGNLSGISSKKTIENRLYTLKTITADSVLDILNSSFEYGNAHYNTLSINGDLDKGIIQNGQLLADVDGMHIDLGVKVNLNLQAVNIKGKIYVNNLFENPFDIDYTVKGYIKEIEKDINFNDLLSRINTTYLEVKKSSYNKD